ncbi:MAG TPA: hypothetical protein VKT73_12995 [Xanthobacteraceae bacterium]|nr:hypothetical protein [Xanthobacteraceae bacterium]
MKRLMLAALAALALILSASLQGPRADDLPGAGCVPAEKVNVAMANNPDTAGKYELTAAQVQLILADKATYGDHIDDPSWTYGIAFYSTAGWGKVFLGTRDNYCLVMDLTPDAWIAFQNRVGVGVSS